MTDETEEKPKREIKGFRTDLKSGATVFVGFVADCRNYYISLTNSKGVKTRFQLSPEAYDAIIRSKPDVDMRRGVGEVTEESKTEIHTPEP